MVNDIKSGIEIHQQLDTHKLFCDCPSILRSDEPSFIVKRRLHAVKGESGKIDEAAKYEAERDREFIYQGYDTTCLVELDEEPMHSINLEALNTALHIALHLNCEILPIVQIMRKTVINGSNTSGFQRTMMIAKNGWIETKTGKVGIEGVFLEEDSARPSGKTEEEESDSKIYKLDRLGIPMVEITTDASIKSAEQCKEVALFIGDVLRSCKVKRGIGTIRQDVNISTFKHPRIEIKGFQDPKIFIEIFNNEVVRQQKQVEIYEELKKRKAKVSEEIVDLTFIFKNTNCKFIKNTIEKKGKVLGFKLINFSGLLGKEYYPGRRFGSEISDYAKKAGVNGIIHSDEDLMKYSFSQEEIKNIKEKLGLEENDLFIIISDEESKTRKAIIYAMNRAKMQIVSLSPSEVRGPNPDATTRFLRPMPGESRMYPETDAPLLKISREIINEAKRTLPKLRSELREELKGRGLTEEMIKLLSHGDKIEEFQHLTQIIDDPNFIARVLFLIPSEIASKEKIEKVDDKLNLDIIESIVENVSKGKIAREDVKHIMTEIAKGKSFDEAMKVEKADLSELEGEIMKIVSEKQGLTIGGYMGLIMDKFKGKISGKDATSILNKILKK